MDYASFAELIENDYLKKETLIQWYKLYPEKFSNKTNGVTQRRWLGLCNKPLADFLSKLCGCDIVEELENIKKLEAFKNDTEVLNELKNIKQHNKRSFSEYAKDIYNINIDPDSVFVVQIKRIHEYKRQLMNILHVMYLYNQIKENPSMEFYPRTFIFGAKAAAGYKNAKLTIS